MLLLPLVNLGLAGSGAAAVVAEYTGAALDYYCLSSQPMFAVAGDRSDYWAACARPFFGDLSADRFSREIVPTVTLLRITQETGHRVLLEDGYAMLQEA